MTPKLRMSMHQSPYAIREQHIHFLRFYDCSYLTLTKRRVDQRLSFTIRSRAVIWRADFIGRTARCAGAIHDT